MWIIKSISVLIPLICVTGIHADVSHLKNLDQVKNEKIPVPLLTNDLPVPSVQPLELPKTHKVSEDQEEKYVVATAVPEVDTVEDVPEAVKDDIPEKSHLPIVLPVPTSSGIGRSLNLAQVDPGFSRPIISSLPNFPLGRSLNLPYFNQQYQFRHVILPENEYLPPAQQSLQQNELENEYLPPNNDYLPPQARNQISNKLPLEDVESDKLKVEPKEEEVVTELPVVVETTEQEEIKVDESEAKVKTAEYKDEVEASDSVVVTKQGTAGHDELIVVHKQQVPQKLEIIPSSGYFYPRPRTLFLYK